MSSGSSTLNYAGRRILQTLHLRYALLFTVNNAAVDIFYGTISNTDDIL